MELGHRWLADSHQSSIVRWINIKEFSEKIDFLGDISPKWQGGSTKKVSLYEKKIKKNEFPDKNNITMYLKCGAESLWRSIFWLFWWLSQIFFFLYKNFRAFQFNWYTCRHFRKKLPFFFFSPLAIELREREGFFISIFETLLSPHPWRLEATRSDV